jgi:hypothetical protein
MSEMFPESKQPKVYRNGKTYLENVKSGLFQHRNALKFQTEMQSEMKELKADIKQLIDMYSKISEKLSD